MPFLKALLRYYAYTKGRYTPIQMALLRLFTPFKKALPRLFTKHYYTFYKGFIGLLKRRHYAFLEGVITPFYA